MKFEELNINTKLIDKTREQGFEELTTIQEKCLPEILNGKDVVGQAETGSGKTVAFCLPILNNITPGNGIQVLVLTPTRELCVQVMDVFKEFGNVKPSEKGEPIASKDREPLVDVFIEDKVVRVIAELPGVDKQDINVKTTESKIIIEAVSGDRNYSTERDLSVRIKPKTANAKYKNGILELTVERKEPVKTEAGFEVKIE